MPVPPSTEERALRGLVFAYLSHSHPRVARVMEAEAILNDFACDTDIDPSNPDGYMVAATHAISTTFGEGATLQQVLRDALRRDMRSASKEAAPTAEAMDASPPPPAKRHRPASDASNTAALNTASSPTTNGETKGKTFSRIDVSKVTFVNEKLKNNQCREDIAAFKQNAKMLSVRGKDFTKQKQKNKGKLYAAGVDQGVHSFKYDESD